MCDTGWRSTLALLHQNGEGTGGHGGCLCIVLSGLQIFSEKCELRVNEWPLQIRKFYRATAGGFAKVLAGFEGEL